MSIDRLSSLSHLMAALRSETARKSERSPARSIPARSAERVAGQSPAHDVEALRQQVAGIVRDVDPADPNAVGKARDRTIRAMLLWEYGPQIREHAEWRPIVEALHHAIESNPKLSDAFLRMIAEMR